MNMTPMNEAKSVAASIQNWAHERPNDSAVVFLADGESESGRLTFGELDRRARLVSGRLIRAGLTGKPILLPAQSTPAFVLALCGCLYAGAIAVPAPFHARNRGNERLRSIVRDANIDIVIGDTDAATKRLLETIPEISSLSLDDLERETAAIAEYDPQSPAVLQYTSGSTGAPKGVIISHRNLTANITMLGSAFCFQPMSRILTWAPLFHDMGLMANLLAALHWGLLCVVMPPFAFLQKPRRWLEAISRYRITVSGAPNFAYELCARRIGSDTVEQLDLSAWALAYCGAEPVRLSTMRRFAQAFAAAGFRELALYPGYGLAEATVFVSGGVVGEGVRVLPSDAPVPGQLVSCGRPAKGGSVVIVEPESREPVPDGYEGEVWVSGDHVAKGYWNNAAATAAAFDAKISGREEAFLRTGDLGFIWNGELYITGRCKNLIIYRGINLHPEDIEATVGACHPGWGAMGAAVSIECDGEERLVVVYEVLNNQLEEAESRAMIDEALNAVAAEYAVRLFDLVLVRRGTLPRTTSGKVQRDRCRTLYLSGELAGTIQRSPHPSLRRFQSSLAGSLPSDISESTPKA
jgi:acyl-CoA synthetase (AMP-forming)/AMP-acid ligase II